MLLGTVSHTGVLATTGLLHFHPSFTQGSSPPVTLLKLTKSGGVVKREKEERRQARDSRIKEYFYGHNDKLKPNTDNARTEQLVVYRVGE